MKKQLYKVFDEFLLQTLQDVREEFDLVDRNDNQIPYAIELEKECWEVHRCQTNKTNKKMRC